MHATHLHHNLVKPHLKMVSPKPTDCHEVLTQLYSEMHIRPAPKRALRRQITLAQELLCTICQNLSGARCPGKASEARSRSQLAVLHHPSTIIVRLYEI